MSYTNVVPIEKSMTFLVTTPIGTSGGIDEPVDPIDPIDPVDPVDPPVVYPELDASTASAYMPFNVKPSVDNISVQHYAVEVDGLVYNADHSLNLVGSEFTIGDRSFVVPGGSESGLTIYVNDTIDVTPFMVRLIPSPDTSKNNLASGDNYTATNHYQHTSSDEDIFFILIPNKGPIQAKATDKVVVKLHGGSVNGSGKYVISPNVEMNVAVQDIGFYMDFNAATHQEIYKVDGVPLCAQTTIDASGVATFKFFTMGLPMVTTVSISNSNQTSTPNFEMDTIKTPSGYYDDSQRVWYSSVKSTQLTKDSPLLPLVVTDYMGIYSPDFPTYGMPTYDVVLNGITHTDIVFETSGVVTLGDYTITTVLGSGGGGNIYFETATSTEPLSFKLILKSPTVESYFKPSQLSWGIFFDDATRTIEGMVRPKLRE